jgi:hypothetical protein
MIDGTMEETAPISTDRTNQPKEFFRQHSSLVIGVSLPLVLVLFLLGSIYAPSLFVKPKYDFIYAGCAEVLNTSYQDACDGRYSTTTRYVVENGNLVKKEHPQNINYYGDTTYTSADIRIYYHDTKKNENRELTFGEAQKLVLDGRTVAPDGFSLSESRDSGGGFFPFFYDSYRDYAYVLKKGSAQRKVDLVFDSSRYYYWNKDFHFVGWVIN